MAQLKNQPGGLTTAEALGAYRRELISESIPQDRVDDMVSDAARRVIDQGGLVVAL